MKKVYIIGAGAGGIGLLTISAKEFLEKADVVVHDRLISPDIIALINHDAEKIFAGKEPDLHHMKQEDINQVLVDKVKQGKLVVRLKGGDPFIFGRGGEEIKFLAQNGISTEVIPGISAAQAAATTLQIPLTFRGEADGVIYLSGHNYEDKEPELDYAHLAKTKCTIVFYMAIKNIGAIAANFIKHGADEKLECAVIQNISSKNQKHIFSNLKNIEADIISNSISNPAIIIIGSVVKKSLGFPALS